MSVDGDYRDYVTEESVDFLDHTTSSANNFVEPAYLEEDIEQHHLDNIDNIDNIDIAPVKTKEMPSMKAN